MGTGPTEAEQHELLWRTDSSDWEAWLVFADQLSSRGDDRGELLVNEHTLLEDPDVGLLEWIDSNRVLVPVNDAEYLEWAIGLKQKLRPLLSWAPQPLRDAMARPISQVLALVPLAKDAEPDQPPCRWVQQHHLGLVEGLQGWLERAFDGVPCPSPPHLTLRQAEAADGYGGCDRSLDPVGPWTDLSDTYLLANQWAMPHLDAEGLLHYLPAVLCFDLRHRLNLHPDDGWLTESAQYLLEPSTIPPLIAYQRERFSLFTPEQRCALAAFCCSYHGDTAHLPWMRAVLAPKQDWITEFQRPWCEDAGNA